MKFVIEPIGTDRCRIVDIDCSDMGAEPVYKLYIPSIVESRRVTEVGRPDADATRGVCHATMQSNPAKYASLKQLQKIIFAKGIERIYRIMGSGGNSERLVSAQLPSTLKVIGPDAFSGCTRLEKINIPDSVEEIGANAFYQCRQLPYFQWPKSLRRINLTALETHSFVPGNAFHLVIPEGIEQIDGEINYGCKITRCTVPLAAWDVFCKSSLHLKVKRLDIPEGVETISGPFPGLEQVTLPSTLKEIGPGAFQYSQVLDHLDALPERLEMIGERAFFQACQQAGDKTLRILSRHITIGHDAFFGVVTARIKIEGAPETMSQIMGRPGALNGTLADEIRIPAGAKIAEVTNCLELTELSLPDTVEEVISLANITGRIDASPRVWQRICSVEQCLKEYRHPTLAIPEGVTSLAPLLLERATTKSITLPESLRQIGAKCFCECSGLTALHIPRGVADIGPDFISGCKNLTSVTFAPDSELERIADRCFLSATSLSAITLPPRVAHIGYNAFYECPRLKHITFPANVTHYASRVLDVCPMLERVTFLADNPSTACYPKNLGAEVDWYVPDHMVAFVSEYVDAHHCVCRRVMPLSALESAPPQQLVKPVTVYAKYMSARYVFAVDPADVDMIHDYVGRTILVERYLRRHLAECGFSLWCRADSHRGTIKDMEEAGSQLTFTPDLLTDAPTRTPLFRFPAPPRSDAPAYLRLSLGFNVRFDFMIGPDETFNPLKIAVTDGWSHSAQHFELFYDGRHIPASAVEGVTVADEFLADIYAYGDAACTRSLDKSFPDCSIRPVCYKSATLPIVSDLLEFINQR